MLKQGDFILVEYTGYDKDNKVFDSTQGEISKKLRKTEGPILVIYGKGQLLKGLEEQIKDLKLGEEKEVSLSSDNAFGPKKKDMIHIMKKEDFRKYQVDPVPGLTVHVDFDNGRLIGLIKSVSGGRVMVDFNHPLAGQDIRYKIKVVEKVEDTAKKVDLLIGESGLECEKELKNDKLTLKLKKDKEMKKEEFDVRKFMLINGIKGLVPEIKEIKDE